MFSVRFLIDRLATLEPSTALTTVWLSIDASCKKHDTVLKECDIQYLYSKHVQAASFSRTETFHECLVREDVTGRRYLEEGRSGVVGELDPVGLLLLLRTEAHDEGGRQEHGADS